MGIDTVLVILLPQEMVGMQLVSKFSELDGICFSGIRTAR